MGERGKEMSTTYDTRGPRGKLGPLTPASSRPR